MTSIKLYPGDNRESLQTLPENSVDSVFADGPYVMESVIKRFGKQDAARALPGRDGAFGRSSDRFIGKTWDASEITFTSEFWQMILRVMKPGAFVFSTTSPRTVDRQMTAMRAAGFVIYPLHAWGYKTGLPKGHPSPRGEGFYFGAGAPKVDFEPIVMAMKPIDQKTFKKNIELHGVGDLNINGCKSEEGKYPSTIIFFPKANKEDRDGSKHATVKPIALIQYLIRHITPPGGVVLDPFAGSGTTGEAAVREGFDCLLMEAEGEYIEFLDTRFADRDNIDYQNMGNDNDDIGLDLDGDSLVLDLSDDLLLDLDDNIDLDSGSDDGEITLDEDDLEIVL